MRLPQPGKFYQFTATFFWTMILGYLWMAPSFSYRISHGHADFSNFYTAAKIIQQGQGHQLYDINLQTEVQSRFSETAARGKHALPYMRLPFEVLLFLPLGYLSYSVAYSVWALFSMVLVGLTAAYLRAQIADFAAPPWWFYYSVYFSFYPIVIGFLLGQDSPLLLLILGLVFVHWRRGLDFRAGCFLGLALIKFQLVLPLLLILLIRKQWRTLAGFSLVAAILFGLSVWLVGWRGMAEYPLYVWRMNHEGAAAAIYPSVMPTLRGLIEGWTDPLHPRAGLDILVASVSLAIVVWAARQWRPNAPRESKIFCAGVGVAATATLLASYHEFAYDVSPLLPFILLAVEKGLRDVQLGSGTRWVLLCTTAPLLFPPLYLLLIGAVRLNLMAVPVLGLAWGLARAIQSWERQPAPSPSALSAVTPG